MKNSKAFTMVELVFAIIIIGVLTAIAIPKFAVTRDDAVIQKAKNTVMSVRTSISTERQKRIMKGDFDPIYKLSKESGDDKPIFDAFNGDDTNPVLGYPLQSCKDDDALECWKETKTGTADDPVSEYTYRMPLSGDIVFELKANRFNCKDTTSENCKLLTR